MVGVAGRSKACNNCRRRHMKCGQYSCKHRHCCLIADRLQDLARPACGQCRKSRLHCGGPRDLSIVLYDSQQHNSRSSNEQIVGADVRSIPTTDMDMPESLPNRTSISQLSLSQDVVFTAFTRANLLPNTDKIVVAPDVSRTITSRCILALSYSYFGIKHGEPDITRNGLRKYGQALSVLNDALGKPSSVQSFDVLEAIMTMAMIEVLISEREDGWIHHARGLERLFDLRGPEEMASLPCLMILEKIRPTIIFAAIALHKSTVLSCPDWKSKPWSIHPERADAMKLLLDILSDCPELFVLRDRIATMTGALQRLQSLIDLMEKCRGVLRQLEEWQLFWGLDISRICTEVSSPKTTPCFPNRKGETTPIWSKILHYSSPTQSKIVTMYHGGLILVLQFLLGLQEIMGGVQDVQSIQERLHAAGLIICRSVDYHCGQTGGEQGGLLILFPLRMAHEAVGKSYPAIGVWLANITEEIANGKRGMWKYAKALLQTEI